MLPKPKRRDVTLRASVPGAPYWEATVKATIYGPLCVHNSPEKYKEDWRVSHVETGLCLARNMSRSLAFRLVKEAFRLIPPGSKLWKPEMAAKASKAWPKARRVAMRQLRDRFESVKYGGVL